MRKESVTILDFPCRKCGGESTRPSRGTWFCFCGFGVLWAGAGGGVMLVGWSSTEGMDQRKGEELAGASCDAGAL